MLDDAIADALAAIDRAKRLITAEISGYPTPISGCDAQFNALLAQRQQIDLARDALARPVFVPTPRQPSEGAGVESR